MRLKLVLSLFFLYGVVCVNLSAQFIYVEGNKLMRYGCPIYMSGANTPWHHWNDFGKSYDPDFWSTHLHEMSLAGLNSSRIWISCDGGGEPKVDSNGTVNPPSDLFWQHMDHLVDQATKNRIFIMATIMSFDHFDDEKPNYQAWRNMINNPDKIQTYIDNYLLPLAKRYEDNPYFFSIDLCNEPEWIHENEGCGKLEWNILQRYAGMCAAAVHNAQSHVLVSIGSASAKWASDRYYARNKWADDSLKKHSGAGDQAYLDYWHFHYYAWTYNYFSSPFVNNPEYYQLSDRPCIIGETPAQVYSGGDLYGIEEFEMTEEKIFLNPYSLGYSGVYPWTSNGAGSGNFGALSDFRDASLKFYNDNTDAVEGVCNSGKNAALRTLALNIEGLNMQFSRDIFEYTVHVSENSTVPLVYAVPLDKTASVSITQPKTLNDTAIVKVVSNDKTAELTYIVKLQSYTSVPTRIDVYPDSSYVLVNGSQNFTARVLDQNGQISDKEIVWSINGGGILTSKNGNTTTFISDGTYGTFTLTAESETIKKQIPVFASLGVVSIMPNATDWDVFSQWMDHENDDEFGSSYVANNDKGLAISHRAWGYGELYAVNVGKSIDLIKGIDYQISFEYMNDGAAPIKSISAGLCNSWDNVVKNKTTTSFIYDALIPSNLFSQITGTVKANESGKSNIYLMLSWGNDPVDNKPPVRHTSYLKNVRIVPLVDTVDTDNDGTLNFMDKCPDDANKTEPGLCGCGVDENICGIAQTIYFQKGWNLFSVNLISDDNSTNSLFADTDVLIVKNDTSFFHYGYKDELNILQKIEAGHGYLAYANSNMEHHVVGVAIEKPKFHEFKNGWQLIGIPYSEEIDVSVITSLNGFIEIKDFTSFKTASGLGTLEKLLPGEAYFVRFE